MEWGGDPKWTSLSATPGRTLTFRLSPCTLYSLEAWSSGNCSVVANGTTATKPPEVRRRVESAGNRAEWHRLVAHSSLMTSVKSFLGNCLSTLGEDFQEVGAYALQTDAHPRQACAGCDGVPNSGVTVDSCGVCGGGDSSCDDPYIITVPPASCIDEDGVHFRVDLAWSAPSNHSTMDRIGIYGPEGVSGVADPQPWSGKCVGQGASQDSSLYCTTDAACPPLSSCSFLWEVPAGQSSGSMRLLGTDVSAISTPFQARIKYLLCVGTDEPGVCTRGYQVASQVISTLTFLPFSPLLQNSCTPLFPLGRLSANKQKDIRTNRQTDKEAQRQTDKLKMKHNRLREKERPTDRQKDTHTNTHRQKLNMS